jgi:polyribonucleotide nucleotidyltransferase
LKLKEKLIEASVLFEEEIDRMVHKNILEEEKRPDGRKTDQLRALSADVGILPHTHGTGLFNRGTTQALSILTLAAPVLSSGWKAWRLVLPRSASCITTASRRIQR